MRRNRGASSAVTQPSKESISINQNSNSCSSDTICSSISNTNQTNNNNNTNNTGLTNSATNAIVQNEIKIRSLLKELQGFVKHCQVTKSHSNLVFIKI